MKNIKDEKEEIVYIHSTVNDKCENKLKEVANDEIENSIIF